MLRLLLLLVALVVPLRALDQSTTEIFAGPFPSWKNIKTDYGAVGDGVADDTAAFQTALNALKLTISNPWSVLYVPAGTYRITKTLTTKRTEHNDYLGAALIGADPVTTKLVWDGPKDGAMLRWDAWYDRVSRLTFDGAGKAGTGIQRAGGFATYGELSDLQFQDLLGIGIDLGHAEPQGIAEQAILRCRFYRMPYGVLTYNYNTLDIYVWHSFFEDCTQAIRNNTGAFHAYANRFLRSKESDLAAYTNMCSSVVGNLSVGSAAFIKKFQAQVHIQGNQVYDATGVAFDLSETSNAVLLDNIVRSDANQPSVILPGNTAVLAGNVFAGPLTWPVQTPQKPFNHGSGAGTTNGKPIEKALDGDPASWAVIGLTSTNNGIDWNLPLGTTRTVTTWALQVPSEVTEGGRTRDPKDVELFGSNDFGSTWTKLDARLDLSFTVGERKQFTVPTPAPYSLYSLRIRKTALGSNASWVEIGEFELRDAAGSNLVSDSLGLATGSDEGWGQLTIAEQKQATTAAYPTPTLAPWAFVAASSAPVIKVGAFTGAAIQAAINQAATLPAGSTRIIHLPKGTYPTSATITVPAGLNLALIGDGGAEHGAEVNWTGSGAGPVFKLAGPSHATLRDIRINGGTDDGADALVIENADQPGGWIYGAQVNASGNGERRVGHAYRIDGVEQTRIQMIAYGLGSFTQGIQVTGGPLLSAGGSTPGRISFLTGASSNGCRSFDVKAGGRLVATAIWYEGDWAYPAPWLDLDATSRGSLALVTGSIHVATSDFPLIRTTGFSGTLSLIANGLDHRPSTRLDITGNGSATRVLGLGNDYSAEATKTIAQIWNDTTSPPGQVASLGGGFPNYSNRTLNRVPATADIAAGLAPVRAINLDPVVPTGSGITQVSLLRISAQGGTGRTAVAIVAAPPSSTPTGLSVSAGADLSLPAPRALTFQAAVNSQYPVTAMVWTQVSGPNQATLDGVASERLRIDALTTGTYVFRFQVSDDHGNSSSDEIAVVVGSSGTTTGGSTGTTAGATTGAPGTTGSGTAGTTSTTGGTATTGAGGQAGDGGGGGGCGLGAVLGILTCSLVWLGGRQRRT